MKMALKIAQLVLDIIIVVLLAALLSQFDREEDDE